MQQCLFHCIRRSTLLIFLSICRLDENILQTVRDQSTAGTRAAQDIEEAKHAIGDLYAKIIEIRKKADASEELVEV